MARLLQEDGATCRRATYLREFCVFDFGNDIMKFTGDTILELSNPVSLLPHPLSHSPTPTKKMTCSCGITVDSGRLMCWGFNTFSSLGSGQPAVNQGSPTPVETALLGWRALTVGDSHTCAIAADASGYCWGLGAGGRLGTGRDEGQLAVATPMAQTPVAAWAKLSAGRSHTCGLAFRTNALFCMGLNDFGQIGTGGDLEESYLAPTAVKSPAGVQAWQDVSAGNEVGWGRGGLGGCCFCGRLA